MSNGDVIYCFTCGRLTKDLGGLRLQDSRFNSNWIYRCVHCLSFKTINATQYLESKKTEQKIILAVDRNEFTLKAFGKDLVAKGVVKSFSIQPVAHGRFKLYERRRIRRELLKALKLGRKRKLYIPPATN